MAEEMTGRQAEVLAFIRACIALNGLPPTRIEISRHFGFASTTAADQHLRALKTKGAIALKPDVARGIVVLKPAVGGGAVQIADDLNAMRARTIVEALQPLEHCCGHCDYEEADGSLIRHCDACCRKIIAALGKLRRMMAKGLHEVRERTRKPAQRTRYYSRTYRGGTLGT